MSEATPDLWKPRTQHVEADIRRNFTQRAWLGLNGHKTTRILCKWIIKWSGWDGDSSHCVIPQTVSGPAPLKCTELIQIFIPGTPTNRRAFRHSIWKNQRFSWPLLLLNQSSNISLYKGNTGDFTYGFNCHIPLSFDIHFSNPLFEFGWTFYSLN